MAWWRGSWRAAWNVGALALGLSLSTGCGGSDDGDPDDDDRGVERAQDKGDIEPSWEKTNDPIAEELAKVMRDEQLFEKLAGALNKSLAFPRDLPVVHRDCDEVNAFYDPETRSLSMCYELLSVLATNALAAMGSSDETGESIIGTWLFVFFHELGHGLVDMYDLPITGREEDSVDNFSTILLLESDMAFAALRAAEFWGSQPMGELDGAAFADEHSLNAQRFFNILCLVYGSDPSKYAALVSEGHLPQERAVRCPAEYASQRKAWDTLLAPWGK